MNKNIFENAKFGDKFRTRDGRKAIYIRKVVSFTYVLYRCVIEGSEIMHNYGRDGTCEENLSISIVSEWQEPFDEVKLERLSYNEAQLYSVVKNKDWQEGFKAGYRAAKQE